ncbi:MAG: hypothetical protein V4663_10630 [Bacteroidota bacterium]
MKKFILFLFTASIFLSCNKKTDEEDLSSTSVTILLLNQQGQNLLNPSSNLNEYNIQAFIIKNGVETLFNDPTSRHPKGFLIGKTNTNQETLLLFSFDAFGKDTEFSTSLIKLGSYGMDTVKCQRATTGNYTRVMKVWYNGILKFDRSVEKSDPIFTIIK